MSATLEARGLAITGRLQATDLVAETPQLICLVGPNGSGKTSLLHALAGIGKPEGTIRIAGATPARRPEARRRQVAFLPASREIAWPLRGRDLVALGGGSPAEVARALEEMGAQSLAPRRVDRLSTGERSRLLIARALAPSPALLLLDEPAANLDPAWQLRLMALLKRLPRAEGRLVIAAMHDLDLAGAYADRLLIMDGGRIAADGAPGMLMDGPEIPAIFGISRSGSGWRLVDGT
jgi:iron complex transport system ATP-binding protein